jgi:hypothetical protein
MRLIHFHQEPGTVSLFKYACFYRQDNIRIYHRKDGPAKIYYDGREAWFIHNQLHRMDGPAFIDPKQRLEVWYYRDEKVPVKNLKDFKEAIKDMNFK